MAFYLLDNDMSYQLEEVLGRLEKEGRPGLKDSIAITWISYDSLNPSACSGKGAGWFQNRLLYPASVVKLIYAVAIESWLQKDLLPESEELREALSNMIKDSSNDATSLIIDLLSGTTSGPSLHGEIWIAWKRQRQLVNKWLKNLNWKELEGVNCCQKTWEDSPYGREREFYGPGNVNRNCLSTDATARVLEAVMTNALISPQACKRLKTILSRSLDLMKRKSNPENQVDGFLGEGLLQGTRLWSKAGWMSKARHDAIWCCRPESNPMLLVVFSQGIERSKDSFLLPTLARELSNLHNQRQQENKK